MSNVFKNFAYLACGHTQEKKWWHKFFAPVHPQYEFEKMGSVVSSQGNEVHGYLVYCDPLSAVSQPDEYTVYNHVISLSKAAVKLGVRMIGLDGYAALLGKRSHILTKKTGIPFTSGSCLVAWSTFEAVYRAARFQRLDLKKAVVAVFGSNDPAIGLCCRKLVTQVGRLVLCSGKPEHLLALKDKIRATTGLEVLIAEDPVQVVKQADVVVVPVSELNAVNPAVLKPASVLCVVAESATAIGAPQAINGGMVVTGGLIKLPGGNKIKLYADLPQGVVHASLAETVLLTMEECFGTYSSDENTNLDKLEEIADMAARHGFEVWVPQAPVL